jgi:hypothetical protein
MRYYSALLFLFSLVPSFLSAQYINWAEQGGGTQTDRGQSIHTDPRGYSAITGSFTGSMTIGSQNVTGGSGQSFFIALYDSVGVMQWARAATGTGNSFGLGITRDGSGNIIATGYFNGTVTIGTTTLSNAGGDDIFVAKYSSSGTFLWAISAGGSSVDQGFALTADASDNIYVTGYITGGVNFGSLNTTAAFYDAFLVKYNSSGVEQWLQKGGGASTDYGRGVAVDGSGNVFLSGDIYGTGNCTFGTVTVNGVGAYDAFVAKYNNSGLIQWVRTGGGVNNDRCTAAAVDPSGNVLVTGFFSFSVSFSSTNLTSLGDQDIFVAKYNSSGTLQWIRQAGGNLSYNAGYGICSDVSGNVFATGTFQNTIAFGPLTMQSLGLDPFVVKYTSAGTPVWIQRAGAGQDDEGKGVGVDTSGHTYLTGWFTGNNTPFGVHTLVSAGLEDIFTLRLDSGIVTQNPTNLVYCAGDSIFIPYQAFGDFLPLNIFTAELSNATGSFTAPITLGTLSGQQSSTLHGFIPANTPAGSGYRVRVNGSLNAATGRMNTANITIKALPATPTASVAGVACAGSSLQLTVNPISGASWSWVGPNSFTSTFSGPVINPASTINSGIYSVRATVNGCTGAYGTVSVSVVSLPGSVSVGNSSPVCSGQSVNLTSGTYSGMSYYWSGPSGFTSNLQNPVIVNSTPSAGGLYSLRVYTSGCSTQVVTTSVTVNTTPAASTAGAQSINLCVGDNLLLTASTVTGASYAWSGPSGFASTIQNPTINSVTSGQAGTYSLYTHIGSCSTAVSTITIIVNSGPPSVTAGSNAPLCEYTSLNLVAGNTTGGSYVWSGPNGFTSNLQNPSISPVGLSDAGVYTLVVSNGCASSQALVSVTVFPSPAAPIASSNSPVCVGDPLTLKATTVTNATYFWEAPSGFTSTTQNPIIAPVVLTDAGIYSVYAIVNGCSSQVSVTTVVVNASLSVPVLSSNSAICEGQTLQLSCATPGATYYWSGPAGWTSAAQNPTVPSSISSQSGVYSCYLVLGGCTSQTGTTSVSITPVPATPVITLSGDTLYSNVTSGNQWYENSTGLISGATQNWYLPTQGGVYFVIVTVGGCSSDSSALMTIVSRASEKEGTLSQLRVYPNPIEKVFYLDVQGLDIKEEGVIIQDIYGKSVGEIIPVRGNEFLWPDSLAAGVYFLRIEQGARIYSVKVVVR